MSVLPDDDRALPHDVAAERALIGGVLVQPDLWPFVRTVPPAAFYRQAHSDIWQAILDLESDGTAIDLLTLRAALERAGKLDSVGGRNYLIGLADGVPRGMNVEAYAALVNRCAVRRAKVQAYQSMIRATMDDDDEQAASIETQLVDLDAQASRSSSEPLDARGQADALLGDIERDRRGDFVMLGLPAIDSALTMRPGEVLQLWARPGLGKTMIACHVINAMVEDPVYPVAFSLEMPAPQVVRRLCRMAFGLTNWRLRTDGFDADAYVERFGSFTLDATPGLSVAQMTARIRRRRAAGYQVRAVLIDHLGLIGGDRSMSTYDRVSTQAREIKDMAKNLDVAVILLVQVNRESGGDGSRKLHLGSARDSGVVEETADYIIGWRRLDRSTTLAAHERDRYRDVLFGQIIKHRNDTPPDREYAYQLDGQTLALRENLDISAEAADDIAAIAARAGGRR